jgi:ribose 5-phosphate isomerase A
VLDQQTEQKRQVARAAAAAVHSGMRLGLGSGTTVALVVGEIGLRVERGDLSDLTIVAASSQTEAALTHAGLAFTTLNQAPELDLAIDGADEIDPHFAMIKGGGGAMLRERIVLAAGAKRLIVVDRSKLVPVLGAVWAVPVEVVQFGWRVAERLLRQAGAEPALRMRAGRPVKTDEGNYILDCAFGPIYEPARLAAAIAGLPGVTAHGIFVGYADIVLASGPEGVEKRYNAGSS